MIKGFSKLSQEQKIDVISREYKMPASFKEILQSHHHHTLQELYNQFSENTISNFYLPYGVAPGFVINHREYAIPMVIEESSVVAAASKAARFWSMHGGFNAKVISDIKVGQLFFTADWKYSELLDMMPLISRQLKHRVAEITSSMDKRGGGIIAMTLQHEVKVDDYTFCIMVSFKTADSMGANFINTCLEAMGSELCDMLHKKDVTKHCEINMAILSNDTPECVVECSLSCAVDALQAYSGTFSPQEFAERFKKAVLLAKHNSSRAVTHNKGIMNGVDAVIMATGNDYRAIEAGVHAYASRLGKYTSLTDICIKNNTFTYTLVLPLSLGTVGGLTGLHPMAKLSLMLLGKPTAPVLMQIAAAAGMANNFSAIAALVTSGIQKGHMKMHLNNMLSKLNVTDDEKEKAKRYFENHTISHSAVERFIYAQRNEESI